MTGNEEKAYSAHSPQQRQSICCPELVDFIASASCRLRRCQVGEALQMQSLLSRSLTETLQPNTQPPSHTIWPEIGLQRMAGPSCGCYSIHTQR